MHPDRREPEAERQDEDEEECEREAPLEVCALGLVRDGSAKEGLRTGCRARQHGAAFIGPIAEEVALRRLSRS
jgi:hypothetical protein